VKRCSLKARTPLKRKTPLKAKGKERFPKKINRPLRVVIRGLWCVVPTHSTRPTPCGFYAERPGIEACHLEPKARGKGDDYQLFPACPRHHDEQEGRTAEFEAKYGLDLTQLAHDYTQAHHLN